MELLELWTILSSNGIQLDKEQMDLVERFARDLVHWNKQVNMISRKDEEHVIERHIAHCMSLLTVATIPQKAKCLDIGTGGGFPGIPIKIARPDIRLLMTDSITKKVKLTSMFVQHLGLRNTECVWQRAEKLAELPENQGRFDVIMARAVAPMAEIISWSLPMLAKGGQYVLLKGGDLSEEIAEAKELFPTISVSETVLYMRSLPWFQENEKKVVIATFPE